MVIKLRSKRLANLFEEVWAQLPKARRDSLSSRSIVVTDDPVFLPEGSRPLGALISVSVKKTIFIIYLSYEKLPRHSDDFVRDVISHLLGNVDGAGRPEFTRGDFEQALRKASLPLAELD